MSIQKHADFLKERSEQFPYTATFTAYSATKEFIEKVEGVDTRNALRCLLHLAVHYTQDLHKMTENKDWYNKYTVEYAEFLEKYKDLGSPFKE